MEYTTNYQLNQWDTQDAVKRTDFNADNAKIDAALGAMADEIARVDGKSRFTKLGEYSITQNTSEFAIDLSGVDWTAWDKVHLDLYTTNSSQMPLYLNSKDSGVSFALSSSQSGAGLYRPRLTFYPAYMTQRYVHATLGSSTVNAAFGYNKLTALVLYSSSVAMPAGAKFILWGES